MQLGAAPTTVIAFEYGRPPMVRKLLLFQYYRGSKLIAACDNDQRMIGDNKFNFFVVVVVFLWYKQLG